MDLWSLTPLCCFGYSGLKVIAPKRGCLDTKSRACHIFLLFVIYFLHGTTCCFIIVPFHISFEFSEITEFSDVRLGSFWEMWVREKSSQDKILGMNLPEAVFIQDYLNICKVFEPRILHHKDPGFIWGKFPSFSKCLASCRGEWQNIDKIILISSEISSLHDMTVKPLHLWWLSIYMVIVRIKKKTHTGI